MFTSGSTGQPKGVEISHRAIESLVVEPDYISLSAEDRVAHLANPVFDASTFEIWGALLNGAAVCIISDALLLSPSRLVREIRERHISTMFITTRLFDEVIREQADGFSSVRQLLFGGERVNAESV